MGQMSFKNRVAVLIVVFLVFNVLAVLFGIWWFLPDGQQRIANPTQFERSVFLVSGQVFGFVSLMQYPLAYLANLPFQQLGFPYRMTLFVFLNSVLSGLFYASIIELFLRMWRRLSIELNR
jgi:hypothetical protein